MKVESAIYAVTPVWTSRAEKFSSARVAARLQIPFVTLDASNEYQEGVIDYLLREYRAGRTPNPDIMCNREVKFGAFYEYAMSKGADCIATGHYARIEDGKLMRGLDEAKDQSYFLWAVPANALAKTLFPLGAMKKDATRRLAKKYDLPNAAKRDSQGICFLGSISVEDFLRTEFGSEPGDAVDEEGVRIGAHDGALLHTLGARITLTNAPPGPWYVVAKHLTKNELVVAHAAKTAEPAHSLKIAEANWLSAPAIGEELIAQYRYHGPKVRGIFSGDQVSFLPHPAIEEPVASGQSLVLYRGDECIGGGIISE